MEPQMVKIEFAYTDEFNQETRVSKTLTNSVIEDSSTFDVLVAEFKLFLLVSGFNESHVSKIIIEDDPL